MICLFSSSLAYSILASVFSTPTANEVCGLYPFSPERETCCMLYICKAFEFLPLYKRTFRFTPAICKDCTVPSHRLAVSKPIGLCRLENGIAILADSKLRLARFSSNLSLCTGSKKAVTAFSATAFFQRLITFCS